MFIRFLITIVCVYASKLSIQQWSAIQTILKHPGCTPYMKTTIRNVIYEKYEGWALNQAYYYQRDKPYIRSTEFEAYALDGLWYAIQKYNPQYPFYPFAKMHVYSHLYRCLKGRTRERAKERLRERAKERSNSQYMSHIEQSSILDEIISKERWTEIWSTLDDLPEYTARDRAIFHWKYDTNIGRYRSNAEVANIMGLSEESIRKSIYWTKHQIREGGINPSIGQNTK